MKRRDYLRTVGASATAFSGLALTDTAAAATYTTHYHSYVSENLNLDYEDAIKNGFEKNWNNELSDSHQPDFIYEDVLWPSDLDPYIDTSKDRPITDAWLDWMDANNERGDGDGHIYNLTVNVESGKWNDWNDKKNSWMGGNWYNEAVATIIVEPSKESTGDVQMSGMHELGHACMERDPEHKTGDLYEDGNTPMYYDSTTACGSDLRPYGATKSFPGVYGIDVQDSIEKWIEGKTVHSC